jgi:hypothetical protein
MPLRRTKRSDGQKRPRWKDGSHVYVESTHANESQCDEVALEPNLQTEPLVELPPLLGRTYEHKVSARDRPARTGADARIEESAAMGEVRLALRPYGRNSKLGICAMSEYGSYVKALRGHPRRGRRRDAARLPHRAARLGARCPGPGAPPNPTQHIFKLFLSPRREFGHFPLRSEAPNHVRTQRWCGSLSRREETCNLAEPCL